jgi:hypothetical protein
MSAHRVWTSLLGLLALALLLAGCAGYRLGPTGGAKAGERSLQVAPVANSTLEPRLGPALSQALRKQIQRDGTFRLDSRGEGDLLLQTEIFRLHRLGVAYLPGDTITPRDYDVTLEVRVTAVDRRTGRQILKKEIKGRVIIPAGTDLVSQERQALPLLADDLARRAISLLADGEW